MVSGSGTAVAKKASAPKKTSASAHPPYIEMVKEALLALKERTGSSHYAIAKHIEEQQKATMPANFKKLLSVQLKRFVASGKLVKVKNSFKIAPVEKKSTEESKLKPKAKPAAAKPTEKKAVKKTVAKAVPAKAKGKTVTKPKTAAKPVKKSVAKSPAKKIAASKVKKAVEKAKKPKSIKSPAKKAAACKRTRK